MSKVFACICSLSCPLKFEYKLLSEVAKLQNKYVKMHEMLNEVSEIRAFDKNSINNYILYIG